MKKLGKGIAAVAVGVALAVGGAVAPASAADGYVYVVVRDGACGAWPAKVTGIQTANITNGWSLNWDYGDNIVYPKVRLNANNVLKLNLRCSAWGRTVGYTVIQPTIYPTSYNQTIWVG